MMKIALSFAMMALLYGCAYPLKLHPRDGGPSGIGEASSASKSMTITVGDKIYAGSYIFDGGGAAFTQNYGTATAVSGYRSAQVFSNSYGTTFVPGSNVGQAFLHGPDGSSMRCQFRYIGSSGLGECIDNKNKFYDLVIGAPR